MKMRLFGVSCLIVLVLALSMIPIVNATVTKEYEEISYYKSDKLYEFQVKLIIEAEEDGTWKTDRLYRIDFFLTVTYINYSYFNEMIFGNASIRGEGDRLCVSMGISSPSLCVDSPIFDHLMAYYKYTPITGGRVKLYPSIDVKSEGEQRLLFLYYEWGGVEKVEPIYVVVKEPTIYTIQTYFGIGIVVGIVASTAVAYFITRRKMKANQRMHAKILFFGVP